MKITVEQAALHKALARVSSVVERRNTIPILNNVLIDAGDDGVWLNATDLDRESRIRLDVPVAKPGQVTVPAALLTDIVRNAPEGAEISLQWDPDADPRMIVRFGRSRYQVPVLSAKDFPVFSTREWANEIRLPAPELATLLNRVQSAMSTDQTRYYLTGAHLHVVDEGAGPLLRTVATDGYVMALADLAVSDVSAAPLIIPGKTVHEMLRILADRTDEVSLFPEGSAVRLAWPEGTLTSKVVDGQFVDYQRVLPKSWEHEVEVDRDLLLDAVRRTVLVSNEKARSVKLTFDDGTLTLQVRNMEAGAGEETIEVDWTGGAFELGFNGRYMLDALRQTESDRVVLRFTDAAGPTRLEPAPAETDHGRAVAVLMPLRV